MAVLQPERWRAWRGEFGDCPKVKHHLIAMLFCVFAIFALGILLIGVGNAISLLTGDAEISDDVRISGIITMFGVLFTWLGHVPGAVALHVMHRRDLVGWVSVLVVGMVISVAIFSVLKISLALLYGPILLLSQAWVMRRLLR